MSGKSKPELAVMAPVFEVSDLAAAVAHYRDRLLFEVRFEWADEEDGPLRYAIVGRDRIEVHLTSAEKPKTAKAYCFVDGIDAYYGEVSAAGAPVTEELGDQPWEMREFETCDPDHNQLIFGEHISRLTEQANV